MEIITLEAARKAGFEPRTYSPFLQHKKIRAHVDFIAEMGESGISLFFRGKASGERFHASLSFLLSGNENSEKSATLVPYLQRNDLCDISVIFLNTVFFIQAISLVEQAPICTWREQCDQRSPCCVFKS
ncbi:hypothetical protein LJC23_02075 [Desulfovibrio sp. OttesenSCG-928-I05]|nr:hypothetical protein [Desulfovibrio sp. OttesenSCG-928-I05]